MDYTNTTTTFSSGFLTPLRQSCTCLLYLFMLSWSTFFLTKPLDQCRSLWRSPSALNVTGLVSRRSPLLSNTYICSWAGCVGAILSLHRRVDLSTWGHQQEEGLHLFLCVFDFSAPPVRGGEGRTSGVNRGTVKFTTPTPPPSSHPIPPFGRAKPLSLKLSVSFLAKTI